uniref:CDP-alcohol phosphatidyltransferase family protein n=1 Tax=Microbulbifer agarilyticus TaxID=260552 RepID=UPI000255BBB1|nr:CDP-alcohol phosphatidyltransferase family protein [Microbulbifer agarilyticus]
MSQIEPESEETPIPAETSPWRFLPTGLSLLRIALIPVIFWLSLSDRHLWALVVYCLGAWTDQLDGWFANRFNWHSYFGALLDPIADRIYILTLIPLLWHYGSISGIYTTLVITRFSIQLTAYPVLLCWLKRRPHLRPELLSRAAMALAFLILGMGFAEQLAIEMIPESTAEEVIFDHTMEALTLIGCILEVWVLLRFLPRYWDVIRGKEDTFD